ncbi:MAG: sugar phosphate nucleotidyltransferase [FCB group bacterium]|nr:sugar phosphate nucleotidyltransferase [FCB group bacterium]
MATGKYQGVILAAGHGSRMGPFGELFPKPIVPICNRPLLAYQLEYLRDAGIDDIVIVIGHLGYRIVQELGDGSAFGVRIRYVEQERRLGIAHAVGQLEAHVDRPFMLFLGDIFFEVPDLAPMFNEMEQNGAAAVLAVKEETDAAAVKKNFSVHLNDDGTVRRVIEKPRHVTNLLKGCGLYLFDLPIFDAIRRTPRTALRDEYEITDAIQILIDYEYPVRIASVVNWDMNVTYIGDLITCCTRRLRSLGRESLIGDAATVPQGTTLIDTVIGETATIHHPIRLERCVVLAGATVDETANCTDTVFTTRGPLNALHLPRRPAS